PTSAMPDEIAIAVCGAHMSGMALNSELTGRGGRFLQSSRTSDAYSLYALAGGPPKRPGLVRGAPGSGQGIELEIWTLPKAEVGGFLAGIPAPLGLGTVELFDGGKVTGFVCEAIGVEGAQNISHLGSWRTYMEGVNTAQPVAAAE
ncbi:MAG: allophanate hydrolase, partial [Pseudomonadota bacterium]